MNTYICPVCGYPDLLDPPYDLTTGGPSFDICPCCGCEYGYEDATPTAKENFLKKWISQNTPWFKPNLKPSDWDAKEQLKTVNIDIDAYRGKWW